MLALLNRVRGGLEADVGRRFDELWAPHRDLEGDEPHRWEYEFRPSPHRHVPACVLVELLRRIASIGPPHGFAAQIFDVTPYGQMERHFNLGMVRMYQERHIPLPRVHTPYRPPRRRPHHEGTAGAVDPPFTPPTGIPAIPGVVHPWYATFQHYYQYWRTMQIAGGIMCPDSP
ncbi:MAG: hypothetical protein M1838_000559 [Thelocarpon superellum]|nr:MAG: hypothetical protein M1838_000559 [Thelocarpon superellum]